MVTDPKLVIVHGDAEVSYAPKPPKPDTQVAYNPKP